MIPSGIENLGSDNAGMLVTVLLACFFLVAMWSSLSRAWPDRSLPGMGPRARGVFLAMRFRPTDGSRTSSQPTAQTGHLTALDLQTARFVSPRFLGRGESVELDLGTLPEFPASGSKVQAEVVSSRTLASSPETYLVTVRFPSLRETERAPLRAYIGQLTGASRLSPA